MLSIVIELPRNMLIATFHKKIRFDRKTFEFRFYRFNSLSMGKRFMIAAHHGEEHFVFHMKLENELWVIVDDVPIWVHDIQGQLSDIIIREMKKI